jgi:hypothetical protein
MLALKVEHIICPAFAKNQVKNYFNQLLQKYSMFSIKTPTESRL